MSHQVETYHHDPTNDSFGLEAAEALELDPSVVFKTLLVAVEGASHPANHVVAVVPVDTKLDLKALASAAGAKKAAMADVANAERLTGYIKGGISPLGQKKRLSTFVEESAEALPVMYVSGGRRGLDIGLSPADLLEATSGCFAAIASR